MSSGIWISVGDVGTNIWLDEVEARCEVVDGAVRAEAQWRDPLPGHYRHCRVRARTWRRELVLRVEPVTRPGSTLDIEITLDWPDA